MFSWEEGREATTENDLYQQPFSWSNGLPWILLSPFSFCEFWDALLLSRWFSIGLTLHRSKTLRYKFGQTKFHSLMVLDFQRHFTHRKHWSMELIVWKWTCYSLIIIRLLVFAIILSCFYQGTSGMGCFTKETEARDHRLVGSIEELAVSVKQLSLSQRQPFYWLNLSNYSYILS